MTSTNTGGPALPPTTPPAELVPGDQVHAWAQEVLHYSGTVETVAVELGFVWIREDGTDGIGARRLLDVREFRIHRRDLPTVPVAQ
jgi:hypothetical protein